MNKYQPSNLINWLSIRWQYLIPQHTLSWLFGLFANATYPPLKNWQVHTFIKKYQVNMEEADQAAPDYPTFHDFFIRQLKKGRRPIDSAHFISPADGVISQWGVIDQGTLIQAKGRSFTSAALLGSPPKDFNTGHFATIYLAPKDYHRVHMPMNGTLTHIRFIPGQLFSVNLKTADAVNNLFARNERVILFFDSNDGPFAVVMVGAMIVGSMATRWTGIIKSKTVKNIPAHTLPPASLTIQKGEALGYFTLGSTVIVLLEQEAFTWTDFSDNIQMGQALGSFDKGKNKAHTNK